jgi:diguanylate cyclase (GGDEF)-like protein
MGILRISRIDDGEHVAVAARSHDVERAEDLVDPGYWPRSTGLRVVIAASYFILIPAGLLPMSAPWWILSGGGLLAYSIVMWALCRVRGPSRLHVDAAPFFDTAWVTLAVVALARPEYPIWMGYFLSIPTLANFHSTRYVLVFSSCAAAACMGAFAALDVVGRADVHWAFAAVIAIMALFTGVNADIIATSNRKLRRMVLQAALTDPLTGLANRRRFRDVLDSHMVPDPRPLGVLMYDIDNFKQMNESRGHVYADDVLVRVADVLRATFRDADVVARYGGDELIVLAHVADTADAVAMGERSLVAVREETGVSMSCGVSVYPVTSETLEAAVAAADANLGRAKQAGKARVWSDAA